jgi:hypothetical protein
MKPVIVKRAAGPDQKITYAPSLQKRDDRITEINRLPSFEGEATKPTSARIAKVLRGRKQTERASLHRGMSSGSAKVRWFFARVRAPRRTSTLVSQTHLCHGFHRAPRFAKPPDRLVQWTLGIAVVGPGFALADQSWSRSNRESCWIEICLPAPKSAASTRSHRYVPGLTVARLRLPCDRCVNNRGRSVHSAASLPFSRSASAASSVPARSSSFSARLRQAA